MFRVKQLFYLLSIHIFFSFQGIAQHVCITAFYPLDGDALDQSGNLQHGVMNDIQFVEDRFGNESGAASFNGISSFINLGMSAANNIRTISLWFQLGENIDNTISYVRSILVRNTSNQEGELNLFFTPWDDVPIGSIVFVKREGAMRHAIHSDSNSWLEDNWHHLAVVIDPTDGIKMYVDNVLQMSTSSSNSSSDIRSEDYVLGKWGFLNSRYFNGVIDDVRLFNCALTEAEISELYNYSPICAPNIKTEIVDGDVYINESCYGVILKSESGNCFRLKVDDSGAIFTESVACPNE